MIDMPIMKPYDKDAMDKAPRQVAGSDTCTDVGANLNACSTDMTYSIISALDVNAIEF